MNDYQPDIVSDAGHGGLEKVSQLNVNKHLTAKVKQMILDGRIPPDTKSELQMVREHEANADNILDEPIENDMAYDADALASAGYGTDEDYGGVNNSYE
tara:strand:+ start:1126 stop:1422 length:297 start_codon:yes stop_codon:yes gene_type:complete